MGIAEEMELSNAKFKVRHRRGSGTIASGLRRISNVFSNAVGNANTSGSTNINPPLAGSVSSEKSSPDQRSMPRTGISHSPSSPSKNQMSKTPQQQNGSRSSSKEFGTPQTTAVIDIINQIKEDFDEKK